MRFTCRPVDTSFFDTVPMRFKNVVELDAAPAMVFAIFDDEQSWPKWFRAIHKVLWTSNRPHGVGSTGRYRCRRLPFDSRSMATSGRGSGVVGYNVQVAVDTKHHLIVTHEVTNDGSDRAQLANIACQAKEVLGVGELEAVADRGYYSGEKILACHEAGITVTLPKPVTSGIEARGRFGKQDFVYLGDEDTYRCPAGEKLKYHYTNEENGQSCGAIGQMRVATVGSSDAVPLACSDASPAGSMRMFWRPSRSASTRTRGPCASVARRPSIPLAR